MIAAGSPGYLDISEVEPMELPETLALWLADCQRGPSREEKPASPALPENLIPATLLVKILEKIPAESYRSNDAWLKFITACIAAAGDGPEVCNALDAWSRRDPEYTDDRSVSKRIASFHQHGAITVATFIEILRTQKISARIVGKVISLVSPEAPAILPNIPDAPRGVDGFSVLDDPDEKITKSIVKHLELTENGNPRVCDRNKFLIAGNDSFIKNLSKLDVASMEPTYSARYRNTDELGVEVKRYVARCYGLTWRDSDVRDVLIRVAYANPFNSIADMLRSFPCPDSNPLDELLGHITFKPVEIECNGAKVEAVEAGVIRQIFDLFFKKMFVKLCSLGHAWLEYPNDVVPILEGPQGIGKTLFCRYLALGDPRFYVELGSESHMDLMSKDGLLLLRRRLIGELGELASLRRSEMDQVKSFLSRTSDEYRPPYGRGVIKIPRTVSFIGTTNEHEYLTDGTGNRRFYPVGISAFNFALFKRLDLIQSMYAWYTAWATELLREDA